jgi:hypothetical protein
VDVADINGASRLFGRGLALRAESAIAIDFRAFVGEASAGPL